MVHICKKMVQLGVVKCPEFHRQQEAVNAVLKTLKTTALSFHSLSITKFPCGIIFYQVPPPPHPTRQRDTYRGTLLIKNCPLLGP